MNNTQQLILSQKGGTNPPPFAAKTSNNVLKGVFIIFIIAAFVSLITFIVYFSKNIAKKQGPAPIWFWGLQSLLMLVFGGICISYIYRLFKDKQYTPSQVPYVIPIFTIIFIIFFLTTIAFFFVGSDKQLRVSGSTASLIIFLVLLLIGGIVSWVSFKKK